MERINTTDNFIKIALDDEKDRDQIFEELLKLSDNFERSDLLIESQKIDDVINFLKSDNSTMNKEAGGRGAIEEALNFVKNLFRSKDPRIQARLQSLIQDAESSTSALPRERTMQEILNEQWRASKSPVMKDFTNEVMGPDYQPGTLPKAPSDYPFKK